MASGIYFSGLASGLDTESIITQLMDLERIPLTRLQQRKNQYNVEKNAWHDIYTRLSSLQSKLGDLKLASTFTGMKATSSNTLALTATAASNAPAGSYQVSIIQLAQAHKVASQNLVYGTEAQLLTDTFTDATYTSSVATLNNLTQDTANGLLKLASGATGSITSNAINVNAANGGRLALTVNQQERLNANYVYQYRTFDGTTWSEWQTLGNLTGDGSGIFKSHTLTADISGNVQQVEIKATLNGDFGASVIPMLADWTATFQPAEPVTSDTVALGLSGSFTITVGSETRNITINENDSLQSIASLINAVPSEGETGPGAGDIVTASVIDHRLVITSKTTGSNGAISFSDPDGVLNKLGLVDASGVILPRAVIQDAKDAVFTVDGLTITRSTNTITDVIQGVTLNLLAVTDTNGNGTIEPAETLNLEISHDTQKAVDAVQALVDQYNSVMDFISTKAGDKGDLQGDPTLARFQNDLWQLMTDRVTGLTGAYQTPWSIGISTGAVVGSGTLTFDRSGKITLDTAKLTAALEADSSAVMAIFTNSSKTGLVDKLDSYLTSLLRSGDGIIPSREQSLQNIMDDIDDQIARMEDSLTMKEDQLRRQFTAMEQALAALQSQGNWLAGQIAGLGAYQQK
ncbi:flagellar filament capping protein FliD [Neomoorella thermoacetica]|uniref:flagellar filament capping protein FliD n=1 Tax=Neomoorella thermoacetica TaxID=1525 RepID=UPI0008FA222D|nr:flagellar filament capping protein FliD [Moorella thermoacetica]OIQ12531.1 flagellar hook-associated protein 2 [Moorella thermoacetica]